MEQWQVGDGAIVKEPNRVFKKDKEYPVMDVSDTGICLEDENGLKEFRDMIYFTRKSRVLTLVEGMGVRGLNNEQKKAIISIALATGTPIDKIHGTTTNLDSYQDMCFDGQEIIGALSVKIPVTFDQFIIAMANTPQKPKEVEVKFGEYVKLIVSKDKIILTTNGNLLSAHSAPLSIIDELVKAKNEVSR